MKYSFLFAILLSLEACGFATKVDPRIAHIRQEHQQLLAKQRVAVAQGAQVDIAKEGFRQLVQQSEAIQQALNQLDPARSQDPAQVALVTELAREQAKLTQGAALLAKIAGPSQSIYNEGAAGGSGEENRETTVIDNSAWTGPTKPADQSKQAHADTDK